MSTAERVPIAIRVAVPNPGFAMRNAFYGLLLSSLFVVPHASAAVLTYTYTGTVSYGMDYTGVFGATNTDLAGKTFTVVERFDTTKTRFATSDGSTFSYQTGGSFYVPTAAGAEATISIGGSAARSFMNDYKSTTQNSTANGTPSNTTSIQGFHSFINAQGQNDFYDESLQFAAYAPSITFDYTQPLSLSGSQAAFSGSYSLSAYVKNFATGEYASFDSAIATLQPTTLTVTNTVSAVPLPKSLPMFGAALLCLAGLGLARRRSV